MRNLQKGVPLQYKIRNLWWIYMDYILFSLAMIAFTWYIGSLGSWTEENLSVVGYWHDHVDLLIIWGLMAGFLFMNATIFLMQLSGYDGKLVWIFTILAGILLMGGVFIPFQEDETSFCSILHVVVAFCGPVSLVVAIASLEIWLQKRYHNMKLNLILTAIGVVGAAVLLIDYTIVTSILEVYVVAVFLMIMGKMMLQMILLQKNGKKAQKDYSLFEKDGV